MNTLIETSVRSSSASSKSWIEAREAVRQLYATAELNGVRHAVGFRICTQAKVRPSVLPS